MTEFKSVDGVTYHVKNELEVIEIDNQFCNAIISLQGAQILEFKSKKMINSKDLLWVSSLNTYQQGKAIRGGIPFCFPWFGGHKIHHDYPAHGFARYLPWQLIDVIYAEKKGHELVFQLKDTAHTRHLWNHSFQLQMKICCQDKLTLHFEIINTGDIEFEYEFVWHSYFPVDIYHAKIKGLHQTAYIDQLKHMQDDVQTEEYIEIEKEMDRIYPKTKGVFKISSGQMPTIYVKSNAKSAVVWNPWLTKAQRLADVGDQAWQDFVCLESGQIKDASMKLAPNASATYELIISDHDMI